MDEKRDDGETAPQKGEQAKGGGKLLFIGILAGIIIANTIIAFVLVRATKPKDPNQKSEQLAADSLTNAREQMTTMGATTADNPIEAIVNIAGTDGERLLKAAIIFEFDDKAFPELGAELARRAPKFKDLLIDHLSKLLLLDVTEPNSKDRIRKDLLRLVNHTLPPKIGEVREVLFTTYIIQ